MRSTCVNSIRRQQYRVRPSSSMASLNASQSMIQNESLDSDDFANRVRRATIVYPQTHSVTSELT